MRAAVRVLMLAGFVFGLYWATAALTLRAAADNALATQHALGGSGRLTLGGFPGAFSAELAAPRLVRGLWSWQAARLQMSASSLAPWYWQLDLPSAQIVQIGWLRLALDSDAMQAALTLRPGPDLALRGAAFSADALQIRAPGLAPYAAERLRLTLDETAAGGARYMLQADLAGVDLPPEWATARGLAPHAESLTAAMVLTFSAPLNRHAGRTPPRLTGVEVQSAALHWGAARLHVDGSLRVDAGGRLAGRLMLHTTDWKAVHALALGLGQMQPQQAPTVAAILAELARAAGTADGLTIPLDFRAGWAFLGPIPLGQARYLQ